MNIFNYEDYKLLLQDLILETGKNGRGVSNKLSVHLRVHSTFITHVLRGKSDLSSDQTLGVCDFFNFSELQMDFFVHLVQHNRAGDQRARKYFEKKLGTLRREGLKLKEQLRKDSRLSTDEQAIFYSDWTYSAVRLATALPEGKTPDELAKLLNLPFSKVSKVISFLLKTGLCRQEKERLTYGTFSTYVGSDSPFAKKLHDNWRLRTIQIGSQFDEDMNFTSAVALTRKDFLKLREIFLEAIKRFENTTDSSESEILAYLNIDWIRIT